jgi:S-DNA-T family DNA segregation ATPase FtsK/SpoIIIE
MARRLKHFDVASCQQSPLQMIERRGCGITIDAVGRSERHSAWNEVFALILLGVGTLLFLALISYTPKDVPSWIWFSNISPANHPAQNFIGPFGAIVAGICYQLIGAAAYLLAAILLGFGAAKLVHPSLRVTRRMAWIVLFIVSGACLLHLQPYHLRGWHAAFNIQGPGGWVGYGFADEHHGLLCVALGKVGSLILLSGIYVTTLILMTGLRPVHLIRQTIVTMRRANATLQDWRLRRRVRKSDLKGKLEISEKQLAKQRTLLEKKLKRKGVSLAEADADDLGVGRNRKWSIQPLCRVSRRRAVKTISGRVARKWREQNLFPVTRPA